MDLVEILFFCFIMIHVIIRPTKIMSWQKLGTFFENEMWFHAQLVQKILNGLYQRWPQPTPGVRKINQMTEVLPLLTLTVVSMVLRVDPPVAKTKFGQKSTSNSIGGMVQSLTIAMVLELIYVHRWSFLGLGWHPWLLIPIPCPPNILTIFSWAKSSKFSYLMNKKRFVDLVIQQLLKLAYLQSLVTDVE